MNYDDWKTAEPVPAVELEDLRGEELAGVYNRIAELEDTLADLREIANGLERELDLVRPISLW